VYSDLGFEKAVANLDAAIGDDSFDVTFKIFKFEIDSK